MAQEFTSRFSKLPDDVKLDFDGTLLMQQAEEGNHVVKGTKIFSVDFRLHSA